MVAPKPFVQASSASPSSTFAPQPIYVEGISGAGGDMPDFPTTEGEYFLSVDSSGNVSWRSINA